MPLYIRSPDIGEVLDPRGLEPATVCARPLWLLAVFLPQLLRYLPVLPILEFVQ